MLKSETVMLRICGNCMYADQRLEPREIQKLKREAYLVMLRRHANSLRDARVLCRRENINVGLLDEACAFWRPHR